MLGEQIGEETGKVMVRRVISTDGSPKVEVTVQASGKLLGIEERSNVTYPAAIRPDGNVYGEGQGVVKQSTRDYLKIWTLDGPSVAPAASLSTRREMYSSPISLNHRVLEYDLPLTTDVRVDRVFVQGSATGNNGGMSAGSLRSPIGPSRSMTRKTST